MANATPHPGQVYAGPEGQPLLYVRTEQRPGSTEPEHLFLGTRERVVLERWLPASKPLPEALRLALDPRLGERLAAVEARLAELEREREGLVSAMKMATSMAPHLTEGLRETYRLARDAA